MKSVIDIFFKLNTRLLHGVPQQILEMATAQNEWFSNQEIRLAVEAIRQTMLQPEALERWITQYEQLPHTTPNRVLIVMAGNIPLVGFFDLLCVLMAGDHAFVKPSHKDRVLMEWIIDEILQIDPSTPINICDNSDINATTQIDRVIATGSDMAIAHFGALHGDKPTLLRGSRHSAAIITNDTSVEDMRWLADDIYTYSGLGCRNVSLIFVPKEINISEIEIPHPSIEPNKKYLNNYRQSRAIYKMSGVSFHDTSLSCLVESDTFPASLSTITIIRYSTLTEVEKWIEKHDEELQCVVATPSSLNHPRRVNFGEAQRPTLYDYADGVDTMKFLI